MDARLRLELRRVHTLKDAARVLSENRQLVRLEGRPGVQQPS